jgi:hypothetical protein
MEPRRRRSRPRVTRPRRQRRLRRLLCLPPQAGNSATTTAATASPNPSRHDHPHTAIPAPPPEIGYLSESRTQLCRAAKFGPTDYSRELARAVALVSR